MSSTIICEYESVGSGVECTGPLNENPSAPISYEASILYSKAVVVYTKYDSSLPEGSTKDEYCREFCNDDSTCLGYLTDQAYTVDSVNDSIRCFISKERPEGAYNDFLNSLSDCWRKIEETCYVQQIEPSPPPKPTSVLTPSQTNHSNTIIGISVGASIIVLLFFAALALFLCKKSADPGRQKHFVETPLSNFNNNDLGSRPTASNPEYVPNTAAVNDEYPVAHQVPSSAPPSRYDTSASSNVNEKNKETFPFADAVPVPQKS